ATAGRRPNWETSSPTTGWPSIRRSCSTWCACWRCSWSWSRPNRNFWRRFVKDRRLNSNGEVEEWERPRTIPDDFIYDPETDAYYAPGEPSPFDVDAWMRDVEKELEEIRRQPPVPPEAVKISDVFAVPAARRKPRSPKHASR